MTPFDWFVVITIQAYFFERMFRLADRESAP
jgi:hypothetical protein